VPDDLLELETPHGPARAHVRRAAGAAGALVLGHGAGGSITAKDLTAVAAVAGAASLTVALVEQPYRVAGRRSPAPARQLDAAWTAVLAQLRDGPLAGLPVVTGGRSSGARVACRTAAETGAAGVLCLAFPLHPPQRKPDAERKTRLPELEAVEVPVLVVQGASDPFGMPPGGPGREVVVVSGNHSLTADVAAVATAVAAWLPAVLRSAAHQAAGS
jgi:predicted alpha/beta-hydrolase family hydrolase